MDRFLYNNTVLRIIALVLACVIWLGVNAPANTNQSITAMDQPFPYVITVQTPPGLTVTSVSPQIANVIVTGTSTSLANLSSEMDRVQVVADVRELTTGVRTVRLKVLHMPPVAHIVQPETVSVVLKSTTGYSG